MPKQKRKAKSPDSDASMSTLRAGHDARVATLPAGRDPRMATPRTASTQQVC